MPAMRNWQTMFKVAPLGKRVLECWLTRALENGALARVNRTLDPVSAKLR